MAWCKRWWRPVAFVCAVLLDAATASATTVALTADRTAPQPVGTRIRFTASAAGGTTPYSFKWWLYNGTTWSVLRDWGTGATLDWAPTSASSAYKVGVWVRSAGATTDVDEANVSVPFVITAAVTSRVTGVELRADKASPQAVGATITFTAQPTGGTTPYSYKWWLWDGTAWRLLRDWGAGATYAWTPSSANSAYKVGVWVRSAGATTDVDEANVSVPFVITAAVTSRVTGVELRADKASPQAVGATITFTAQPTGGTTPYSYKWWLWDGTAWRLLRDWGAGATYAWAPSSANGAYKIGVWVRSAGATTDVDEANVSVPFAIGAAATSRVTAVSLAADRTAPQPAGTTVRWTATPTGGTAPRSYKWWLSDGRQWTALSDWTTANELAWTPTQPNEAFRIGVWVKSAGNATDVDEANVSVPFPIRGGVPDCLQSLEPAVVTMGSGGGAATVSVVPATAGCAWTVASQATWITVTSAARGTGAGTVSLTAAPNPDKVSRTGYVMVGAKPLSVTQGGVATSSGCTYAVFPTTLDVGFNNETATVAVTAPSGCAWNASAAGFTRLSPSSGAGSGTVTVSIENNTAQEPRGTVITVAGRAVTVTQAGRAANPQGCTYSVTPAEAAFDFRATSTSLRVSTQAGCAWTATESSSFVSVNGASSGSGSGSVTVQVDANPLTTPRSALVMIAGEPVTIAQGAAGLIPLCVYRLSATSVSMSYAGGSGSVGVSTTSECAWEVASHTDWIHVTEASGPTGNGAVWFSIDANALGPRAGTLVIAGQVFTVAQGEPPSTADPDEITWVYVEPDPTRVGQCEGNCGAGCGTFFNPCGGPHYWERTLLSAPQYVGDDWEPVCSGGSSWFVVKPRYSAMARWTYHGLKSSKCEEHDATCRGLNLIPFLPLDKALCLATAGLVGLNGLNYCDGAQPFDWSYDFLSFGHGAPVAYVDGPPCE